MKRSPLLLIGITAVVPVLLLVGCRSLLPSAPSRVREFLTEPSSASEAKITEKQIMDDLVGKELLVDGRTTWTFDSVQEFRSLHIAHTENKGYQETYTVEFELVGNPTGEEAEATAHVVYKHSGNSFVFQSVAGDSFEVTDDRRYIGKQDFPAGMTYTKTETQTFQFGSAAPAQIRLDNTVSLEKQTEAFQRLKNVRTVTVVTLGDLDLTERAGVPAEESRTEYINRYTNGTMTAEGASAASLSARDDLFPHKRLHADSTWLGQLRLSEKVTVPVQLRVLRFETDADRMTVVVMITNLNDNNGERISVSGQMTLDCATALPIHTDLSAEIFNDHSEMVSIKIVSDGKFTSD